LLKTFQKAKKMNRCLCNTFVFLAFYFFTSCKKDPPIPSQPPLNFEVFIKDVELPWGMGFLPGGDFIFLERKGNINLLKKGEPAYITLMRRKVQTINTEGGLLGLAIDPDFNTTHHIFIYETTDSNRVVRLTFENNFLKEDKVIVGNIPQSPNHDGGALGFGPDGYLYIGTGDASNQMSAQDKNSLAGKILRVDKNGNAPADNPFSNKIWSMGHRNVQGFTWADNGKMLATEHGPTAEFGLCCHDEINLIEAGKNYGWPLAIAGEEKDSLTLPLIQSGFDTWAPSGCTIVKGKEWAQWRNCLVVATLRGQRLIRFTLNGSNTSVVNAADTFEGSFNRLRNIIQSPDGSLLFSTSNKGYINPLKESDDKIYRLYIR